MSFELSIVPETNLMLKLEVINTSFYNFLILNSLCWTQKIALTTINPKRHF